MFLDSASDPVLMSLESSDIALVINNLRHLSLNAAETAVSSISNSGNNILVSTATIGKGGTHHVNEQPKEYWIEKFEEVEKILDAVKNRYCC